MLQISKKCLESVFSSVSDDFAFESLKDSIEFSSISEISDDHQLGEFAELHRIAESNAFTFIGDGSFVQSHSIVVHYHFRQESNRRCRIQPFQKFQMEKNNDDIVSVEAEMVVNHLKQAQIQVMNSASTDLCTKKLLDALINVVIEEFNVSPEEKDHIAEIVKMKTRVVLLSFLLWILVV
ncbi:hypothetical protein Acr_22g0008650 [Actinidia rufa]|uniref:Uncharacterized protein n=1 Tax=Actinidia rufa TaxID=165716 RepID=A0A7J0GKX5_9ERIC|nr:hypothetical protein Acr_22g0008650 [Actinidia rufa]